MLNIWSFVIILANYQYVFNLSFSFLLHFRSIISECLASFFYVFIVCGAAAGAGVGASVSSVLLATALASGLAMGTLTQCFLHISGKHNSRQH